MMELFFLILKGLGCIVLVHFAYLCGGWIDALKGRTKFYYVRLLRPISRDLHSAYPDHYSENTPYTWTRPFFYGHDKYWYIFPHIEIAIICILGAFAFGVWQVVLLWLFMLHYEDLMYYAICKRYFPIDYPDNLPWLIPEGDGKIIRTIRKALIWWFGSEDVTIKEFRSVLRLEMIIAHVTFITFYTLEYICQ